MTEPLERLPTYLSCRGSGPNVVRTKVLKNDFFFFLKMIFNVEWGFFIFYFFKWAKGDPLSNLFLQSWCLKVNSIPLARKDLKSLNTCNQICFFILKIFRLSLQRQSKKWNAWESHILGTSKKGKNPKFEDLKILENLVILFSWELLFYWKETKGVFGAYKIYF